MNKSTLAAETLTDIILTIFRINGRLLEIGDDLVKPLGINSARWQLLGAVSLAAKPLSAPQIGDAMGVSRQGAQKQLNKMVIEGFFAPQTNPHHQRSPLYALTEKGRSAIEQATNRQSLWATQLANDLDNNELASTRDLLNLLQMKLEASIANRGENQ